MRKWVSGGSPKIAVITKRAIERAMPGVKIEKGFDLQAAIELNLTFHSKIDEVIGKINAEHILKSAYMLQLVRVKQMMDMEARLGMPFSWGHHNLQVLAQIGEALRKLEAGDSRSSGRGAFGSDSGRSHMPGDAEPASQYRNPLDGVDPDLLRAAAKKVSDLMAGFGADLESSAGSGAGTESTTSEETGSQSSNDSYFPGAKLGQLY